MVDDPVFAKVNRLLSRIDGSDILIELCKGNECLGEAHPRKHYETGRIHTRKWIPSCCINVGGEWNRS